MSWKSMSDRKKGDKAKNRTIQYKEQRPQAWCGNALEEYWKKKDIEYKEKQSS